MKKFKDIEYSKEDPLWTGCTFEGPPPPFYTSWSKWAETSCDTGLFTGIKISALRVNDNEIPEFGN